MKRIMWTTTEYTSKINPDGNPLETNNDKWQMFATRGQAEYDARWLRDKFPESAKKCGGPKIVKINLSIDRKKP